MKQRKLDLIRERPTRGLIFTSDLIPGVMTGAVTVTSRAIKPQPPEWITAMGWTTFTPLGKVSGRGNYEDQGPAEKFFRCPFRVGEIRYVKEAWARVPRTAYWHDQSIPHVETGYEWIIYKPGWERSAGGILWRSSMFMPRAHARTWIEILSVRPARCQDITRDEILASGIVMDPSGAWCQGTGTKCYETPLDAYAALWDRLNRARGFPWSANCWVWRCTFRTVTP